MKLPCVEDWRKPCVSTEYRAIFSKELVLDRPSISREVLLDQRADEPPWSRTLDASRGPVTVLGPEETEGGKALN